jgi:hypothetical protein
MADSLLHLSFLYYTWRYKIRDAKIVPLIQGRLKGLEVPRGSNIPWPSRIFWPFPYRADDFKEFRVFGGELEDDGL